jgi:Carboxypeptidase regulatory-like domain
MTSSQNVKSPGFANQLWFHLALHFWTRMRLRTKQGCRSHLRAFVIMLVCTGATLLAGCDGFTHLKGVVLDSADKPVANADVTLIVGGRNQEVKTSENGVFVVGMAHSPWNPELSLSVAKAGYKTFERRFHPDEHLQTIVVTLQAAPDTSGSGQPRHSSGSR